MRKKKITGEALPEENDKIKKQKDPADPEHTKRSDQTSFRCFKMLFQSHFFTSTGTNFNVIIVEVLFPHRRC